MKCVKWRQTNSVTQPRPSSWLRLSQSVSNSYVLSAKQSRRNSNYNIFCVTRPGIEPQTSRMPDEGSTTTFPWPWYILVLDIFFLSPLPQTSSSAFAWPCVWRWCRWSSCFPAEPRSVTVPHLSVSAEPRSTRGGPSPWHQEGMASLENVAKCNDINWNNVGFVSDISTFHGNKLFSQPPLSLVCIQLFRGEVQW